MGEKNEFKDLNITAKSDNSSFNKINLDTDWVKIRSEQNNTTINNYVEKIEKVKVITLDEYVKSKKIEDIDFMKIDTQGYEDKILEGEFRNDKK